MSQSMIDGFILNSDGTLPRRLTSDTVVYQITKRYDTLQVYYRIEVGKEELLNVLEKNEIYQGLKYFCDDYRSVDVPELGLKMTFYFSSENEDGEIAYTLSNETCNWN